MRVNLLKMTYQVGSIGAHIGGSLSLVEIMATLYLDIMNIDKDRLSDNSRDRLILSKGHGVMAQYAAMAEKGILSEERLFDFKKDDNGLPAHPSMDPSIGIEFSSGSLGQGLSLGVGSALALRYQKNDKPSIFVVVGDGECDEGQIWEAAMTAGHFKLENLICIIDRNHLQYDGNTSDVKRKDNLASMWRSFGWQVAECDGHNIRELHETLTAAKLSDGPFAVIANTIKGKGVSFMESQASWHNNRLTEDQLAQAIQEVVK